MKITEKTVADTLRDTAHVLVSQQETQDDGTVTESLRRVPLSAFNKGTTLLVTVSKNEDGTYTANKTYQEITDAAIAGKTLLCCYYDDDVYLTLSERHGMFTFAAVVDCVLYQVTIPNTDRVSCTITNLASSSGLTTEQITALDSLFRIAAYTQNAQAEYAAFRKAFGLEEEALPEEPDIPDDLGEPVYRLAQPTTFNGTGTDAIDTGLQLMASDETWSITIGVSGGEFNWNRKNILRCAPANQFESFTFGISQNGNYNAQISGSHANSNGIYPYDATNIKAVLVRIGERTLNVYYVQDGKMACVNIYGDAAYVPTESPLVIGESFNGTVNDVAVYMGELTEEEIRAYLEVTE